MPAPKIEVRDQAVLAALDNLAHWGEDPEPVMRAIGEHVLVATEARFEAEAGPGGAPWAKLSPRYAKKKKGDKILTESGHLRSRIVYKLADNTLTVGTNVIYAAIHQFGGSIQHAAYSIKQRLRTDAKGNLLRQAGHGNLARYAKASHKRARTVIATIGAHAVTLPARPFLGVDAEDRDAITHIVGDAIGGAWSGGTNS